jgi:phenolic acid decarboxylase
MLTSILGARLSWHLANGWVFEPAIVGPDIVDYHLKEGPHAGRHAIQHFYYQRVAPGVETTVWYEESGAVVHFRDTNGAPLRCSSRLAGRRYDRLSG